MGRRRAENDPSVRTDLTERQREVLALMAKGATNVEIAERLGLSLDGAKWHVREIFGRLGVDSRDEAVTWWNEHRRRRIALAWIPIGLFGTAAVAAAVAIAIFAARRNDEGAPALSTESSTPLPTSTATATPVAPRITPTPLKEQPTLREVASGDEWRLFFADDRIPLPPTDGLLLAINWDLVHPLVDVLNHDGKLVARVQTAYRPVAHLNSRDGTLVISDVAHPDNGERARVLVFDLRARALLKDIALEQSRMNPIIFADIVALSANGEWLYWVEHGIPADTSICITTDVCDMATIHAVNLVTREPASLSAPLARGCGVPAFAQYGDSAVIAQCSPQQGTRGRWIVDATRPQEPAADAPANAPKAYWEWSAGSVAGLVLSWAITNDGSFTSVALRDVVTGDIRAEMQVTDTWGAFLLNTREVLFLRSNGRLERVDIYTGAGSQLPYAIEPGRQGLDIALVR